MRYLIRLCLPIGLIIWLVYRVVERFITIPDVIAMPMMIISVLLMMVGITYHGWCFGKGKSPYEFKKKK